MLWDKGMSDNITTTIIDDDNNYYEYHLDEDRVIIFNRYDGDKGEEIFGEKANEIRAFALNQTIIPNNDVYNIIEMLKKSNKDTSYVRVAINEEVVIEILSDTNCNDLLINLCWRDMQTKKEFYSVSCNYSNKEEILKTINDLFNRIKITHNL